MDTTKNVEMKHKKTISLKTEAEVQDVMQVLREAHIELSLNSLEDRIRAKDKQKELKKHSNPVVLQSKIIEAKKNQRPRLKSKIKLMRKHRIFPQPISIGLIGSRRKRHGILKAGSIKI